MPSVSSLEEAATALGAAHAQGGRVRIGKDVTTEGLARVLEHQGGDLTCTVEAGIRLSALGRELARAGQRLSLDPPGDPTVGAVLAENQSGPLRHRFGAVRDLVLGVTLVLADGTVASSGGKVVKNVAGYDLARLVCGSRGRFALVARASFRLHPLPRAARTLLAEPDDVPGAVATLLDAQLEPSALDVLRGDRVAVLFEGSERAVEAQLRAARTLVGGVDAGPAVWDESRALQRAAPGRVRFEPGRLADVLEAEPVAVARPAAGVAYVDRQVEDTVDAGTRRLVEAIRAELDPQGVLAG